MEFDVHLAKDKNVVVIYDGCLNRTITGSGLVGYHTLTNLGSLSLLSGSGDANLLHHIPALEEVFDSLPTIFLVCFEMKARMRGMWELPQSLMEVITRYLPWESFMVSSFNPVSIFRTRKLDRRITIALK